MMKNRVKTALILVCAVIFSILASLCHAEDYDYDVTKNVLFGLPADCITLSNASADSNKLALVDGKTASATGKSDTKWYVLAPQGKTYAEFTLKKEMSVDTVTVTSGYNETPGFPKNEQLESFYVEYWDGNEWIKIQDSEVTGNSEKSVTKSFEKVKSSKYRLSTETEKVIRVREISLELVNSYPDDGDGEDGEDEEEIPDYSGYDYNVYNNLLFGLSPSDITVSSGDAPNLSALADGKRESASGNSDTKWFVLTPGAEEYVEFRLPAAAATDKLVLYCGKNTEILDSGKLQIYRNDAWEDVPGASFSENKVRLLTVEFPPVRGDRFRLYTDTAKRFRIIEIQLEKMAQKIKFKNIKENAVLSPGTITDEVYIQGSGDYDIEIMLGGEPLQYEKDGDYFTISFEALKSANYTVTVNVNKDGELLNDCAVHFSVSVIKSLLETVNSGGSAQEADAILANMADDFLLEQCDLSEYTAASEKIRLAVCEKILENAPIEDEGAVKKIYAIIQDSMLMAYLNESETVSELKKGVNKIETGENVYLNDYFGLSDECKEALLASVIEKRNKNGRLESEDEFIGLLKKEQAIYVYNNTYALSLEDVFSRYSSVCPVDLSGIESKYKSDTLKELKRTEISDYRDIPAALEEAYKKVKKASSGGGSGGSPSRPSGGGKISIQPSVNEEKPESKACFSDMHGAEWAQEAVDVLCRGKIISGKSEDKFYPDDYITREEFVKIAVAAFGFEKSDIRLKFKDTDESSWEYPYIAIGVELGIINGISEDTFGKGVNISREDIAVILHRIAQIKNIQLSEGEGQAFSDSESFSEYAKDAVGIMNASGIITGYSDGSFKAKENATRAEAAVLVYRLIRLSQG